MGGAGGLKLLKNHKNVNALPLLGKCEPEKPLLQILVLPALHIKLGVVYDALEQLDKHHHHNQNHHHHQPIHPLLQEKYTGLETARLWNMFCWSGLSKYLPFTVNIWVHRRQIYNI